MKKKVNFYSITVSQRGHVLNGICSLSLIRQGEDYLSTNSASRLPFPWLVRSAFDHMLAERQIYSSRDVNKTFCAPLCLLNKVYFSSEPSNQSSHRISLWLEYTYSKYFQINILIIFWWTLSGHVFQAAFDIYAVINLICHWCYTI